MCCARVMLTPVTAVDRSVAWAQGCRARCSDDEQIEEVGAVQISDLHLRNGCELSKPHKGPDQRQIYSKSERCASAWVLSQGAMRQTDSGRGAWRAVQRSRETEQYPQRYKATKLAYNTLCVQKCAEARGNSTWARRFQKCARGRRRPNCYLAQVNWTQTYCAVGKILFDAAGILVNLKAEVAEGTRRRGGHRRRHWGQV